MDGRKSGWKIDIPARYSSTGKRGRYFFTTKTEAENFADDERTRVKNFGMQGGGTLSPSQSEQALAAFSALSPHGVTLNEVVQDWLSRKRDREQSVPFSQAKDKFLAHLAKKKIKGRRVSGKYQQTARQVFGRFPSLSDKMLSDIDARTLALACEGMTPSVKFTALAVLSSLFNWSAETPRHWVKANPAKDVPRDDLGARRVDTFSPADVKTVLKTPTDDDIRKYHVLGFFAGIRPEELPRVREEFINLPERVIVLPHEITKTGVRRVIEINDTLLAWLEWFASRSVPQPGPIISPVNIRKRLRAFREKAGVAWIQDGMRHSYASYWLAIHKDEHRLRDNLGHRSADELWDHYHKAKTQKEAKEFWNLTPTNIFDKSE
ncbi:hypothetical protein DB345_12305 [Spartobacteria bacterium LR76]|nr:hypothetical protein DB345_12305 [Spartobacteria bacterium LR76]